MDRENDHTWNWCSVGKPGCLNKTRSRNGKICRPCMDANTRAKDPEYFKLVMSNKYLQNREYRLNKQRIYRQEHKEEISFRNACYRDQHREELNEYARRYRKRTGLV
jgi:hypothetical protein